MPDGDSGGKVTYWRFAPIACCVVLAAGVLAGVFRALRHGGHEACAGIPLPRCRWLTSRWAVRIAAWASLIAGICGQLSAARQLIWRQLILNSHSVVPVLLRSITIMCYVLLVTALFLAGAGLRWRDLPEVRHTCRQAAKASLLGGLAAGLASEVCCDTFSWTPPVPSGWRYGCALLGGSSGLLLLGLQAAHADGASEREGNHMFLRGGAEEPNGTSQDCLDHEEGPAVLTVPRRESLDFTKSDSMDIHPAPTARLSNNGHVPTHRDHKHDDDAEFRQLSRLHQVPNEDSVAWTNNGQWAEKVQPVMLNLNNTHVHSTLSEPLMNQPYFPSP